MGEVLDDRFPAHPVRTVAAGDCARLYHRLRRQRDREELARSQAEAVGRLEKDGRVRPGKRRGAAAASELDQMISLRAPVTFSRARRRASTAVSPAATVCMSADLFRVSW